jgi:Acetyltransferase (GNAT) domain
LYFSGLEAHARASVDGHVVSDFVNESSSALLYEWLCCPHVAQWWQPTPSIDELRADYVRTAHGPNETKAYVASYEGEPIGFIQSYVIMGAGGGWWEDETDPGRQRHRPVPLRRRQARTRTRERNDPGLRLSRGSSPTQPSQPIKALNHVAT